ncbi:hypothetical protein [Pedomonas mirosovicensis]|uniref:hypothetical protein n=1 Tax=Pedomonas mirosovicensis TaxID=2908641 RepID=UPI00216A9DDA|nr:hypothetical protein [Pedomonas mirosovicensis]MCH8684560.1 hypothetical protein [Pedomonas mirosovicensis]
MSVRTLGLGAILLAAVFLVVAILGGMTSGSSDAEVAPGVDGAFSPRLALKRADEVTTDASSETSGGNAEDRAGLRHPSEAWAR